MEEPKLWWIVRKPNSRIDYLFCTYNRICKMFNELKIYDYCVVHPFNTKYPVSYRKENEKNLSYINAQHERQIERLKELHAPALILDNADNMGQFVINPVNFD